MDQLEDLSVKALQLQLFQILKPNGWRHYYQQMDQLEDHSVKAVPLQRVHKLSRIVMDDILHLQQLIRDLATSENYAEGDFFDQTPHVIKQVLQSGKESVFKEHLSTFIHKKEVEIEHLCKLHYQEFIHSVDQLLKIRSGTTTITKKLTMANDKLQLGAVKIFEKKRELIDNRSKLLNIELALEAVQTCLFVLDIANRVIVQTSNRKYFSALRMLSEITKTHLALIENFAFCKPLEAWIPRIQEEIRLAVLRELKEWFKVYVSLR
jgi:hypothetical protein